VPPSVRVAMGLLVLSVALRAAPLVGLPRLHGLASVAWGGAFLLWLAPAWPALSDPARRAHEECG
jgi:hypothetical protein